MNKKIAVVGLGSEPLAAKKIVELSKEGIEIVSMDNLDKIMDRGIDFNEPIPFVNPYLSEDEPSFINRNKRLRDQVFNHINGKRTLRDEYNLILEKKSKLSKRQRDYVVREMNNESIKKV